MLMPPTWNVGRGQSQRSSGEARSHALTAAALARKAWRERQTMDGVEAEEPEVGKARWPLGMASGGGVGLSGARGFVRRRPGASGLEKSVGEGEGGDGSGDERSRRCHGRLARR
jgi:hypothetical protein